MKIAEVVIENNPLPNFLYFPAFDFLLGRKCKIVLELRKFTLVFPFDSVYLLVIFIMLVLAFVTELLLSYLVGLIAFWTDEVDGLYRTIERVEKFFSGGYFPLSILPAGFVNASFLLPFAYSFYVPAQLYLKKIDLATGLKGILVQLAWIVLLYGLVRVVWERGLRKYEGIGI